MYDRRTPTRLNEVRINSTANGYIARASGNIECVRTDNVYSFESFGSLVRWLDENMENNGNVEVTPDQTFTVGGFKIGGTD